MDFEYIKQKFNEWRFKKLGVYVFDKLIFNILLYGLLGFIFYVAWSSNFDLDYYYCDKPYPGYDREICRYNSSTTACSLCENPFYKETTWKNAKYLPAGYEYGTKPTTLFNSVNTIVFVGLILAFLLNHLLYNRGKVKIDLE